MSGGLIQIPIVKKACLENKNGALMHTFLYLSLFIIHSLICWPSDIPVGKHSQNDNNKPPEVRHCGEAYLWRLTSLLVVALNDNSAFSDACKSYTHFSATSKKVTVTWLRCKHCMAITSSQAGTRVGNNLCNPHGLLPGFTPTYEF